MIKVNNRANLAAIRTCADGDKAYIEDEKKYLFYQEGKWKDIEMAPTDMGITLYDLNKMIIGQGGSVLKTAAERQAKIKEINKWEGNRRLTYVLYNKDIGYFSIFEARKNRADSTDFFSLGEGLIKVLSDNFYELLDIEILDDITVEIWVRQNEEDEPTVMYLFNNGAFIYG